MSGLRCLLVLGMTGAVSCGPSGPQPPKDRQRHPLLDSLKPPPLNRPVASAPVRVGSPGLAPGKKPALLLLAEGRPFRGSVTGSGRVTTREGRMEFASEGRAPIQILYRLPEGLPAIDPWAANGSALLVERSNPAGPDRLVVIRKEGSLQMAHVWIKSANPVRADLGDGLRLVQAGRPAAPMVQPLAEPGIELLDGHQSVGVIPTAQARRIQTRAGAFTMFVETNRLTSIAEADGQAGAYVLKAWLVRSEP